MYCFLNHVFIFNGDYKLPGITWIVIQMVFSTLFTVLLLLLVFQRLLQPIFISTNTIFNSRGTLLDLVFTECSSLIVENTLESIVPINKYHPSLINLLTTSGHIPFRDCANKYFNYQKANFSSTCSFLATFLVVSTFQP